MQKNNLENERMKQSSIFEHVSAQLVFRGPGIPESAGINWTRLKDHAVSQRFNVVQYDMAAYVSNLFGLGNGRSTIPFQSFVYSKPSSASWRLIVSEAGEALTKTGKAWIVAGLRGEPMIPFTTEAHEGKPHAEFAGRAFVIIHAKRKEDNRSVIVVKVEIDIDGIIKTQEIFTGIIEKRESEDWIDVVTRIAPPQAQAYSKAIAAACEKSGCYHCRHVHYSQARLEG